MVAKVVFARTRWWSTRVAFQLMGRAMTPGFPADVLLSICPKALVNMTGWYCSTPSSSQIAARPSCSAPAYVRSGRGSSGRVEPVPRSGPGPPYRGIAHLRLPRSLPRPPRLESAATGNTGNGPGFTRQPGQLNKRVEGARQGCNENRLFLA